MLVESQLNSCAEMHAHFKKKRRGRLGCMLGRGCGKTEKDTHTHIYKKCQLVHKAFQPTRTRPLMYQAKPKKWKKIKRNVKIKQNLVHYWKATLTLLLELMPENYWRVLRRSANNNSQRHISAVASASTFWLHLCVREALLTSLIREKCALFHVVAVAVVAFIVYFESPT